MAAFGSAIGGGGAIEAAMARRGMGGPAPQQVSPAGATFDPNMQPAAPVAPQAPAMPVGGAPAPQASAMGPTNSESSLIIKALSSRLAKLP